jgi:hypothetical protein
MRLRKKREVRQADINRGWGKFFSKSCKAIWQSNKYGGRKYSNSNKCYENNEMNEQIELENFGDEYDDSDELNENYG